MSTYDEVAQARSLKRVLTVDVHSVKTIETLRAHIPSKLGFKHANDMTRFVTDGSPRPGSTDHPMNVLVLNPGSGGQKCSLFRLKTNSLPEELLNQDTGKPIGALARLSSTSWRWKLFPRLFRGFVVDAVISVRELAEVNLVQQGAELAYLLRHDPEFGVFAKSFCSPPVNMSA